MSNLSIPGNQFAVSSWQFAVLTVAPLKQLLNPNCKLLLIGGLAGY